MGGSAGVTGVSVVRDTSLVFNDVLDVFNGGFEVHALNCSDSLVGVLVVNSDGITSSFDS